MGAYFPPPSSSGGGLTRAKVGNEWAGMFALEYNGDPLALGTGRFIPSDTVYPDADSDTTGDLATVPIDVGDFSIEGTDGDVGFVPVAPSLCMIQWFASFSEALSHPAAFEMSGIAGSAFQVQIPAGVAQTSGFAVVVASAKLQATIGNVDAADAAITITYAFHAVWKLADITPLA